MSAASLAPVASQSALAATRTELAAIAYPVPGALQQFLQKAEGWALENRRKAMREGLKFWSLKAAAILAAGSAAVMAAMHGTGLLLAILNGILVICVVLDGILRPGKNRDVHLRACEGFQNLKDDVEDKWLRASYERCTSSSTLAQILEDGWKARKKITEKNW